MFKDLEGILGATAGALVMLNLDELVVILTKRKSKLEPQIEIKYVTSDKMLFFLILFLNHFLF